MPVIHLTTHIAAPVERVFDLARSIDAHVASTDGTSERAIAGRTTGLIEIGERVTWEARHLGITQRLTVEITRMERPRFFEDRMLKGAFRRMNHRHEFRPASEGTEMRDLFEYEAPVPIIGRVVERLYLTNYLTRFLRARAESLKRMAETEEWRRFLEG